MLRPNRKLLDEEDHSCFDRWYFLCSGLYHRSPVQCIGCACACALVTIVAMVLCSLALFYSTVCDNVILKKEADIPLEMSNRFGNVTHLDILNSVTSGRVVVTQSGTSDGGLDKDFSLKILNFAREEEYLGTMSALKIDELDPSANTTSLKVATEVDHSHQILGYDTACKNSIITASIPSQSRVQHISVQAHRNTDVDFQLANQSFAFTNVLLQSAKAKLEDGNLYMRGVHTQKEGKLIIATTANDPKQGLVRLQNIQGYSIDVSTESGSIEMNEVLVLEGGSVRISTNDGKLNLKDIKVSGDSGDIIVTTQKSYINLEINGRYFNGMYNLQTKRGLVYVNPGMNLVYNGDAPTICSSTSSWRTMPTLRSGVPSRHNHCVQGRIGFAYGKQRLIAYSQTGNITVTVV